MLPVSSVLRRNFCRRNFFGLWLGGARLAEDDDDAGDGTDADDVEEEDFNPRTESDLSTGGVDAGGSKGLAIHDAAAIGGFGDGAILATPEVIVEEEACDSSEGAAASAIVLSLSLGSVLTTVPASCPRTGEDDAIAASPSTRPPPSSSSSFVRLLS